MRINRTDLTRAAFLGMKFRRQEKDGWGKWACIDRKLDKFGIQRKLYQLKKLSNFVIKESGRTSKGEGERTFDLKMEREFWKIASQIIYKKFSNWWTVNSNSMKMLEKKWMSQLLSSSHFGIRLMRLFPTKDVDENYNDETVKEAREVGEEMNDLAGKISCKKGRPKAIKYEKRRYQRRKKWQKHRRVLPLPCRILILPLVNAVEKSEEKPCVALFSISFTLPHILSPPTFQPSFSHFSPPSIYLPTQFDATHSHWSKFRRPAENYWAK